MLDKTVEAHCHKQDRYGREVCKVMRGSTDVNLEQLRAGMAWWYREYAKEQTAHDRASYAAAEDDARARRIGLWKGVKQVSPWERRKLGNERQGVVGSNPAGRVEDQEPAIKQAPSLCARAASASVLLAVL